MFMFCNVGYFMSQLPIVNIFIVFFFTTFQVETTAMARRVKIAPHSCTFSPSDFQIKSSRLTILK